MYKQILKIGLFFFCFCSGLIFGSGELHALSYHQHRNVCPTCKKEFESRQLDLLCDKNCSNKTWHLPCSSCAKKIKPTEPIDISVYSSSDMSLGSSHLHYNVCPKCKKTSYKRCTKLSCSQPPENLHERCSFWERLKSLHRSVCRKSPYYANITDNVSKIKVRGRNNKGAAILVLGLLIVAVGALIFLDHTWVGICIIVVGMVILYFWFKMKSVGVREPPSRPTNSESSFPKSNSFSQQTSEEKIKKQQAEKAKQEKKDAEWREKYSPQNVETFLDVAIQRIQVASYSSIIRMCYVHLGIAVLLFYTCFAIIWFVFLIVRLSIVKKKLKMQKDHHMDVDVVSLEKPDVFLIINVLMMVICIVISIMISEFSIPIVAILVGGYLIGLIFVNDRNKNPSVKFQYVLSGMKEITPSLSIYDVFDAGIAYRDGKHGCQINLDLAEKCFKFVDAYMPPCYVKERIPKELNILENLKHSGVRNNEQKVKNTSREFDPATMTMDSAGAAFVSASSPEKSNKDTNSRTSSKRSSDPVCSDSHVTSSQDNKKTQVDNSDLGKYYYDEGMAYCTGKDGHEIDFEAAKDFFQKAILYDEFKKQDSSKQATTSCTSSVNNMKMHNNAKNVMQTNDPMSSKHYYDEGMAYCTGNDGREIDYEAAKECFKKAMQYGDLQTKEKAEIALKSVDALR